VKGHLRLEVVRYSWAQENTCRRWTAPLLRAREEVRPLVAGDSPRGSRTPRMSVRRRVSLLEPHRLPPALGAVRAATKSTMLVMLISTMRDRARFAPHSSEPDHDSALQSNKAASARVRLPGHVQM
jgi:hypothetical protein